MTGIEPGPPPRALRHLRDRVAHAATPGPEGPAAAPPAASRRPSRAELEAARARRLPDVMAPGLRALFVGINPGLYSAAVGHHFARPGNRFWPALARAGLTPRLYRPSEDGALLALGFGITNLVPRTTARADELTAAELVAGVRALERKVRKYGPRVVAVLGVTAYRVGFEKAGAALGEQPEGLGGARLIVLPNPSGLNAHHPLATLARRFEELLQPS